MLTKEDNSLSLNRQLATGIKSKSRKAPSFHRKAGVERQYQVARGTMANTLMGRSPLSAAGMYTCSRDSHTSSASPTDPMSPTVVTPVHPVVTRIDYFGHLLLSVVPLIQRKHCVTQGLLHASKALTVQQVRQP